MYGFGYKDSALYTADVDTDTQGSNNVWLAQEGLRVRSEHGVLVCVGGSGKFGENRSRCMSKALLTWEDFVSGGDNLVALLFGVLPRGSLCPSRLRELLLDSFPRFPFCRCAGVCWSVSIILCCRRRKQQHRRVPRFVDVRFVEMRFLMRPCCGESNVWIEVMMTLGAL